MRKNLHRRLRKKNPPEKGGKLGECEATEAKGGGSFMKRKIHDTAE